MEIIEVNIPILRDGHILVQNQYSVISSGTEIKTVSDARKGYYEKIKSRPKEVKQIIELTKTHGILNTYKAVKNKLEFPSPLGYSSAGKVIDIGANVDKYNIGDLVACGGNTAVHAEVISVPVNLCVKINEFANLKSAALTTLGSIALQGIRQADLKLGENCAVIGLGLIGQLTLQLLNAAGINSFGIDVDQNRVDFAKNSGATFLLNRNTFGLETIIKSFTDGFGVDAAIITAGTDSNDPVELGGLLCRHKGKVIIVGSVPVSFNRENFYKKELDVRMSCSYGPGRYDSNYEDKGIDYPIGYVRWTENRNMKAFVNLLAQKKINPEILLTHEFNFEDAPKAYELILKKSESFIGILLKYKKEQSPVKKIIKEFHKYNQSSEINLGFIGAGSFAKNILLPNIPGDINLGGVATAHGNSANYISKKYKFAYLSTFPDEIIKDPQLNTIFIVTRNNLHSEYVLKCLDEGKNIFVEKPLCLTESELVEIKNRYIETQLKHKNKQIPSPVLMVGFNRRFSPYINEIKKRIIEDLPKAINYRINAGNLPKDHWTKDPKIGGGRIIGEVCHFIDLSIYIAGSEITSIFAASLASSDSKNDSINIILTFQNGSTANISYLTNGNRLLPKEYIEIFYAGSVFVIDDFKELQIYSSKKEKIKFGIQDKGHKKEIETFLNSIRNGKSSPISFEEIYLSTLTTFQVLESVKSGKTIKFE